MKSGESTTMKEEKEAGREEPEQVPKPVVSQPSR